MQNDDDFEDEHDSERREAQCRNCGSREVRWRMQGGKWALFSLKPGVEHRCEADDLAKDFE